MENLTIQPDGSYALAFKNYKAVSDEEIKKMFNKYGKVASVRKSSEQVPWVFIRYRTHEEALAAYKDLQECPHFDIRVATSGRKLLEQGGTTRERGENYKRDSREKGQIKGNRSRSNFSENSPKDDDGDNDEQEAVKSPVQRLSSNRREGYVMDAEDDYDYNNGDVEVEVVGNNLKKLSVHSGRKGNWEDAESPRGVRSISPPRVSRKSGGIPSGGFPSGGFPSGGARARQNPLDDGPPKLVNAVEYYASLTQQHPYESGLACRAVFDEVWTKHPLREEMQLREVILTNFRHTPTKREVHEICSGINLLHVTIDKTPTKEMPFCRVLVASEEDAEKLYELDGLKYQGLPLYVSSLEYILDEMFEI